MGDCCVEGEVGGGGAAGMKLMRVGGFEEGGGRVPFLLFDFVMVGCDRGVRVL